jgi:hypothetical protein
MSKIDAHGPSRREFMMTEQHQDFGDLLYSQMKNAPWVMCSVGIHGLLIGFLLLLPNTVENTLAPTRIQAATVEDQPVLEEEPKPDVKVDTPIDEIEKSEVDPTLTETKFDPKNETDDDLDSEDPLGDPDQFADSNFDAMSTNGIIATGQSFGRVVE